MMRATRFLLVWMSILESSLIILLDPYLPSCSSKMSLMKVSSASRSIWELLLGRLMKA